MLRNISKFISLIVILTIASFVFSSKKVEAATISVASGTDTIAVDSSCSLSEAIGNINDQAVTNADCAAGDGIDDTITLPSGTITLSADLPDITESIEIIGQGMSNTTIDGDNGQYRTISVIGAGLETTLTDFKIIGALRGGIYTNALIVNVSRIEIDGTGALVDPGAGNIIAGLFLAGDMNDNAEFTVEDLYIHDIEGPAISGIYGLLSNTANGNTSTLNVQKVAIARLHNTASSFASGAYGFSMYIGVQFGGPTYGNIDAQISNVTVHDLLSDNLLSAGFGAIAFANNGTASINLDIFNITLTKVTGLIDGPIPSIGLYSGAAAADGYEANANINAQNALVADTFSGSTPQNCKEIDLNFIIGGSGTVNPTITSQGHNLSSDSTCNSFNQPGDMNNVTNLTSTLGPLQNNGGITPTRALLPGSPAIGAGAAILGVSTDQRGIPRPSTPDVGAYQTVLGDTTTTIGPASSGDVGVPNTGYEPSQGVNYIHVLLIAGISINLILLDVFIKRKLH